jgi:excisionase family DNA binding protein
MEKGPSTRAESPYMTVQEVAEYLRIHAMTVHRLLNTGKLPGFRTGAKGNWRIPRKAILELGNRSLRKPIE